MYKEIKRGVVRLTGGALAAWPIGAVYISFVNTDPGTIFGGTWVSIASGRMLIGVDPTDATMDAPGDIGGAKTHTLATNEMPSHAHTNAHTHTSGSLSVSGRGSNTPGAQVNVHAQATGSNPISEAGVNGITGGASSATGLNGGGDPHNNLPPYYAVYMWRRSA